MSAHPSLITILKEMTADELMGASLEYMSGITSERRRTSFQQMVSDDNDMALAYRLREHIVDQIFHYQMPLFDDHRDLKQIVKAYNSKIALPTGEDVQKARDLKPWVRYIKSSDQWIVDIYCANEPISGYRLATSSKETAYKFLFSIGILLHTGGLDDILLDHYRNIMNKSPMVAFVRAFDKNTTEVVIIQKEIKKLEAAIFSLSSENKTETKGAHKDALKTELSEKRESLKQLKERIKNIRANVANEMQVYESAWSELISIVSNMIDGNDRAQTLIKDILKIF